MYFFAVSAEAVSVAVAGVSSGKAVLVVDGGAPKLVAVGQQMSEGVRLIAVEGENVTVEVDRKRRVLRMGQSVVAQKGGDGPQETRLQADSQGHYQVQGAINGQSVHFLVDTGATMVSLGAKDASRLGINWHKGQLVKAQTANGQSVAWKISLDSVRVGEITLFGVDGLVHESDIPSALLGMSFLSRTEMSQDGSMMLLKKRY